MITMRKVQEQEAADCIRSQAAQSEWTAGLGCKICRSTPATYLLQQTQFLKVPQPSQWHH